MAPRARPVLGLFLAAALVATGCSAARPAPAPPATQPSAAAPATDLLQADWSAVLAAARGQEVAFHMWGGSDTINTWMDRVVVPRVRELYGVTLRRVPIQDTAHVVNKLLTEKQAGRAEGSVDLVWINGENFKAMKQAELLWGPIADRLPNYSRYYDTAAPDLTTDFGTPVEGLEVPWGKAQFVLVYDNARVPSPPRTLAALAEWVKANPGRFTYPAPPDFTGSAFIRHVLYATTGGYQQYLPRYDEALLTSRWDAAWQYLRELRPHLWQQGRTYPESVARLNQLYADGEVWLTMGYSPSTAEASIRKGIYPATTRTFVFDSGTLANTHYIAIPQNAPHKAAALAVANYLLSPEAQMAKAVPENWGDLPALDPGRLSPAEQQQLAALDRGVSTLSVEELAAHRVPELAPEYVTKIEAGWVQFVARDG